MTFMYCFMFRTHMVPLLALNSKSYISALWMALHLPRTFGSPASVSDRVCLIPDNLTGKILETVFIFYIVLYFVHRLNNWLMAIV